MVNAGPALWSAQKNEGIEVSTGHGDVIIMRTMERGRKLGKGQNTDVTTLRSVIWRCAPVCVMQ